MALKMARPAFGTRVMTIRKNSAISSGVEYPTVSGRLIVVAPASMTASITRQRKSGSLRVASSRRTRRRRCSRGLV
jgi:hypothetical protein